MKMSFRFQLLLTGLLLLAVSLTGRAQSWQLVDDYQPDFGTHAAYGGPIAAGGPSNLVFTVCYSHGTNPAGPALLGVVRRSANQGATWETVDTVENWIPASRSALAVSPTGPVVAVGQAKASVGDPSHWLVRLSADGGTTWTTADDYNPYGGPSEATSADVAADGTIFVAGYTRDASLNWYYTVRRSVDQGMTWETVMENAVSTFPDAIKSTRSGLYIVGGYWGVDGNGRDTRSHLING